MRRAALGAAFLVLIPAATAAGERPEQCTESGVMKALAEFGEEPGAGIGRLLCGDVTKDGSRDGVFTLLSGGTAGPTRFGVLTADGIEILKDGYKVSIDIVSRRRFDVQQPIYKDSDANCCPSAYRFTKYVWTGEAFKARKGKRYKKPKARFYD